MAPIEETPVKAEKIGSAKSKSKKEKSSKRKSTEIDASTIDSPVVSEPTTAKPKKEKKEKSNKKIRVEKVTIESTTTTDLPQESEAVESKPKKERTSKKTTIEVVTEPSDVTETPQSLEPTASKPKKEKSSKKRKATTEIEPAATPDVLPSSTEEMDDDVDMVEADAEDSAGPPSKKRKTSVDEIEVDITAPEPPSKKALRALKKGKPLPPSKSGAETKPEVEKKPEQEKRSEHGVWIGNLAWSLSKDELRKFFVEFSDLTDEMITRIHMPGPDDKKSANQVVAPKFGKLQHNKGFAYVDFSTAKGVELALELSEQLLTGRRVLVKDNKSFEGRPDKTKEETRIAGKPPNRKVFLGNLRFDATEESLVGHFEKCGAIESVKVATFEDTGKCKGYAWIVFEDIESAEHAVRGYVMMKVEASDDEDEESESDGSDEEVTKPKAKKSKMRKYWVNKIMGRPLKIEFAEDDHIRYKKRYGKEGTKRVAGAVDASGEEVREARPAREAKPAGYQPIAYDLPYGGAHMTGGIVEATGKKTTF